MQADKQRKKVDLRALRRSIKRAFHGFHADGDIVESIGRIVEYLYESEKGSWWEADAPKSGHIFNDVKALKVWLEGIRVNRCANCGSKTKYPKYCTAYKCRMVEGTVSMYNKPRGKN